MRIARVHRLLLCGLLATTTAACGGLPMSGPVGQGLEVGAPDFAPIHLRFDSPAPDATPAQIVQGFLTASWSGDEDYAAGRAYLTPEASASWRPRESVTVYSETSEMDVRVRGDEVTIHAPVVARLDAAGQYRVAATGEADEARLRLAKVGGQWRIAELPEDFGVWLSSFYFERAFRSFTITYADPFDRTLISDHRWFPLGPGLATTVARAQLGAVPAYLRGAATTGFPEGTGLAVDSVPVVDKVARIELTREASSATAGQRRAAWAQMLRTMRQLPGVAAVALSVDGGPWQVMGVDGVPASVEALGYSDPEPLTPAVVLRHGEVLQAVDLTGWVRGGENQRTVDTVLPVLPKEWGRPAVSGDLDRVAAVDVGGTRLYRWQRSGGAGEVTLGSGLTPAAIDRHGRTWVGGRAPDGRPRVWWASGTSTPTSSPSVLRVPWLRGRLVAVEPGPGGCRLALAVADAKGRTSVFVAGVALDEERRPVAADRPWLVATGLTQMRDLTWIDDATLGLVAATPGEEPAPAMQPLGGPVAVLNPVPGARHITTSGGPQGVVVVDDQGRVWRRVGATWQRRGTVDAFVVPGG